MCGLPDVSVLFTGERCAVYLMCLHCLLEVCSLPDVSVLFTSERCAVYLMCLHCLLVRGVRFT